MRAAWLLVPVLVLAGCDRDESPAPRNTVKTVLVVHGGAGVLTDREMRDVRRDNGKPVGRADYETGLRKALQVGYAVWKKNGTSVETVEAAIRVLEDDELFNAGRGAALDEDGQASLDASLMEGRMDGEGPGKADPRKRAGAVAAVQHIKNPISAARAVLEMKDSRHVLLVGDGAEAFALSEANQQNYRIDKVVNSYFWTNRRLKQILSARDDGNPKQSRGPIANDDRFGTVGAVALDSRGMLAAGTSTGGLTNKMRGRVGDTPLPGAGTYADNRACGVSCTGTGEVFIRHAVAYDVIARMVYKNLPVADAVNETIHSLPDEREGVGGLIALDRHGQVAFGMSKESVGMYRGYVTETGEIHVAIYRNEELKRLK